MFDLATSYTQFSIMLIHLLIGCCNRMIYIHTLRDNHDLPDTVENIYQDQEQGHQQTHPEIISDNYNKYPKL